MSKESKKKELNTPWKKIWYFIWDDDSVLSWLVNIVIAFVLIKFIIYPGLGLVLGTTHPVVAVVSGSMEHKTVPACLQYSRDTPIIKCVAYSNTEYRICDKTFAEAMNLNFDQFYTACGDYYSRFNITKADFSKYPFSNGFNTGDIIVLMGKDPKKINVGDVIVYSANQPDPIIHRVIRKWEQNGMYYFTTKGDHNSDMLSFESEISQDRVIGKAAFRIPLLGYIKIWFVELLQALGLGNSVGRLF